MEEWKFCEEYPPYEVSSLGRFRRGSRILKLQIGGKKDKNDYWYVKISINNKKYFVRLHRLVAKAFVPNPYNLPEVNHKDSNRFNAKSDNLEWVSSYQNKIHTIRQGRNFFANKTSCKNGHKFDTLNTIIRKNGNRSCRECGIIAQRKYQKRKKLGVD